ncbi:hypothetical protein OSB04_005029 [Centaurea solstitialis]|uniref:Protein kinase domain-containing protein n=1 Tax=Centaurea solstitialis TaxID=347529 RepID=A0AA38TH02_9ASTR|nr:hypothetical protein OSB04_005029 [Centaurea solstitialis]
MRLPRTVFWRKFDQRSVIAEVQKYRYRSTAEMSGVTKLYEAEAERVGLILGFSAGLLLVIASVLCVIMSIKASERRRRKSVVNKREMMEMAEAVDAAAEVMRMEDANELEKKVRKLHQGIALKKSGSLVFYTGESRPYTVEQLMRASAELLGSGSVGTTYKALLDNGVIVCVKRLDASRLAGTTNEEFERHMEVVGKVRHPNVVAIGAYFQAKEEKLIVCDYQPNGSLFSLIHGSKSTAKPLHWTSCLKIAEDVAQGLAPPLRLLSLRPLPPQRVGNTNEQRTDRRIGRLLIRGLIVRAADGEGFVDHPELSPDDVVKWVRSSRDGGGGMAEKPLEMITEVGIACCVRSPEMRPTMWQVITMLQEIKEAAIMEDCGIGSS